MVRLRGVEVGLGGETLGLQGGLAPELDRGVALVDLRLLERCRGGVDLLLEGGRVELREEVSFLTWLLKST